MNRLSPTCMVCRRIVPLLIAVVVVVVLAVAGWRALLRHAGGAFTYAPEDARWVLSDRAHALIDAALNGLDGRSVVDYGVLAISDGQLGVGAMGNDSFYRHDQDDRAGPLAWVVGRLRLRAAGVVDPSHVDAAYVSRLLRQIRAMPVDFRVHLIARGWRYDNKGRRDAKDSYTHVANSYVWWLAQQAPDVIVPVVSIHPYRPDAVKRLARWAKRGVKTVAWQPLRQNIDLNDPRTLAFYKALARYKVALQLPVGDIDTAYDRGRRRIDPLALRAALKAGVSVLVSVHAGHGHHVVRRLARLLRGPHADQLRVLLAGVLSRAALGDVLMPLLQHPRLYPHYFYASNYPVSAVNMNIDLDALADRGFIPRTDVAPLREIYDVNPMLFVFVTLRLVHLPYTHLRLPATVFAGGDG